MTNLLVIYEDNDLVNSWRRENTWRKTKWDFKYFVFIDRLLKPDLN